MRRDGPAVRLAAAAVVVASGGGWGFAWMLAFGMTYTMVSGTVATPQAGAALIAGALAALAGSGFPRGTRQAAASTVTVVTFIAALLGISGGRPLGLEAGTGGIGQALTVAAIVTATAASVRACLWTFDWRRLSRHQVELAFVRLAKGMGLLLFTVVAALPFYVMVMTSLKSQQALLANPLDYSLDLSQAPATLLRSYVELFGQYHFGTFLWNSALVSVGTVILTLAFAIPGAYAVARLRFRGREVLSQSILLIYMIPMIVLVIPLYAVFSQVGLRNSLLGLLIVYPATTIPVALYMLQGYFRGLPAELEEAGLLDGLKRPGVIAKITLPLSLPALASVGLYVFMIAWNEFLFAFMFLDDIKIFTLARGVVSLNSSEVPRQHLMAAAVVATVPVLVVFLAAERFLVAGLTAGSVKG